MSLLLNGSGKKETDIDFAFQGEILALLSFSKRVSLL